MPIDAADHGFLPTASGLNNAQALQRALDLGGCIVIDRPGTYLLAATVRIGSDTTLRCGAGIRLRKVDEQGPFSHVLVNQAALNGGCDENIAVEGMHLEVAGVDHCDWQVFGLRGQLAFFRVRDLRIHGFRCPDLGKAQYGIHICTFTDVHIRDVIIAGLKDGIHFGRGRRFTVRDGVFTCFDDAIALNGHDYDTGNPELGWIEDGLIENCHDLDAEKTTGFFARILAGGWGDWRPGMEVRKSDTVVSEGRLYRVRAQPDGVTYRSLTRPTHATGSAVVDDITWVVVQSDDERTAGVRNVIFRDITLRKARTAFSIHFDDDKYSRSWYPGAPLPRQEGLVFDGIRVAHAGTTPFLSINTPVDAITVERSLLRDNVIRFIGSGVGYGPTSLVVRDCTFAAQGPTRLLQSAMPDKVLRVHARGNIALHPEFAAITDWAGSGLLMDGNFPNHS